MSKDTFGHVDLAKYPVGTTFSRRDQCLDAGIHRHLRRGIVGDVEEGAYSIVISGGYEDDDDKGLKVYYTGSGGRQDDNSLQYMDQTFEDNDNQMLKRSCETKRPVRVVRGAYRGKDLSRRNNWLPRKGYRYDGLYIVDQADLVNGKSGHKICQFVLRRINDEDHPPTIPYQRISFETLRKRERAAK